MFSQVIQQTATPMSTANYRGSRDGMCLAFLGFLMGEVGVWILLV